jgi:hypothetical protein
VGSSSLPVAATQTAMRRIGRQRGPLTRRIEAQGVTRFAEHSWVARLNLGGSMPAPVRAEPLLARLSELPTTDAVTTADWNYKFTIAAEDQPLAPLPTVDPLPGNWDYPGHFRSAIFDHFKRLRPPPQPVIHSHVNLSPVANMVLEQMHPRVALVKLIRAAVSTSDAVLQPTANGVTPTGAENILMEPSFPQPMYQPLTELSQDLLLPGLDAVEPDTVLGLETNRAFVESYMVGLNFEMARELLWRGFPTDQQGTYFKNFWAYDTADGATADVDDLRKRNDRALGAPPPNAPAEQFVLLLRSSLLRRYPNALIYLSPVSGTGPDQLPIFNGALNPDINFFGFQISAEAAAGDGTTTGFFIVIQEHPTEPRFGLDVGKLPSTASHLAIAEQPDVPLHGYTWGRNSAHMAGITRRRPVRIRIRVKQLLAVH